MTGFSFSSSQRWHTHPGDKRACSSRFHPLVALFLLNLHFLLILPVPLFGEGLARSSESVPASPTETGAEDLLESARVALIGSDFPSSIVSLEDFLSRYPTDLRAGLARLRLASAYLRLNQIEKAEAQYLATVEFYGSSAPFLQVNALATLAGFYSRQKRFHDAIETWKRIAREHSDSRLGLEAPFQVAALYEQQARLVLSESAKDQPLEKASEGVPARLPKEARMLLERAVREYRKALDVYSNRAEKAIEQFFQDHDPVNRRVSPDLTPAEQFWAVPPMTAFGDTKNAGYFANRARLGATDREQEILSKIASLKDQLGNEKAAEKVRRELNARLNNEGDGFENLLDRADQAIIDGRFALAFDLFLAALKSPRMAPATLRPLMQPNIRYLQDYRRPQTIEMLSRLFDGLLKCSDSFRGEKLNARRLRFVFDDWTDLLPQYQPKPPAPSLEAFMMARIWEAAYRHSLEGKWIQAEALYQGIGEALDGSPFQTLSSYWMGESALEQGLEYRARLFFQESLRLADSLSLPQCGLRTRGLYGIGLAYFREGRYPEAAHAFESLSIRKKWRLFSSRDEIESSPWQETLRSLATYRLAQCQEFQGRFKETKDLYRKVVRDKAASQNLRDLAQHAPRRIERHWENASDHSPLKDKVFYLGENRGAGGDLGDWKYNYGEERFILCGMATPQDVVGGRRLKPTYSGNISEKPLSYRFYSGEERQPGRRWITERNDRNAPGALWNPVRFTHTSSNWDDFGEQLGPDGGSLFVELSIPDGTWQLALSFIDDGNYFEGQNRIWTVYIKDLQDRFLAATEVSDHLCGVYKHFGVVGPIDLRIAVCRDLSLNTLLSGIFLDPNKAPFSRESTVGEQTESSELSDTFRNQFKALEARKEEINKKMESSPQSYFEGLQELASVLVDLENFCEAAYSPKPRPPLYRKNPIPPEEVIVARRWALEAHQVLDHPRPLQAEALQALADAERRKFGDEVVEQRLTEQAHALRQLGPIGRAELVEDQRVRLAAGNLEDSLKVLNDLIEQYFDLDRNYARDKFDQLLDVYVRGRSRQTQVDRVRALANYHRGKSRWDLVEQAFRYLKSNVPPEKLPDEYFRYFPDAFRYQQRYSEAVALLLSFQKAFPDRTDAAQVLFELVINYCGTGQPEKAQVLLESQPGTLPSDKAANARHLIASAYLKKNRIEEAQTQLDRLLEKHPGTNWTRITKQLIASTKESSSLP